MFHKRFPRRTSGFFSNFYCSPPFFPPPSVANPKNGTIPVLHVSLPALGCPHQQPVGDGMKQPPCPGGLTTILPLSRLCQQLQPTCSGSQSDLQKGSFASFPRVFSKLLDPAELPAAGAVVRGKGMSHQLGAKRSGKLCGFSEGIQQKIQEIKQIQDVAATPRSV